MDRISDILGENGMNVAVDWFDEKEIRFYWADRDFSICEEGGCYLLFQYFEGLEQPLILENTGVLTIVERLKRFKTRRQEVSDAITQTLGVFGAKHGWHDERSPVEGEEWGNEGGFFWGFEFRISERCFRMVYYKEEMTYVLMERIVKNEDQEDVEMVEYISTEDLEEIQRYISEEISED